LGRWTGDGLDPLSKTSMLDSVGQDLASEIGIGFALLPIKGVIKGKGKKVTVRKKEVVLPY